MRQRLIAIGFILSFGLSAQNKNVLFIEGGTCFNVPLQNSFVLEDNHQTTTSYHWEGTTRNAGGCFLKVGIERPISLNHKFQLSFPVGLTFRNQFENIQMKGYEWGCTGGFGGTRNVLQNNNSLLLSIGPRLIFNSSEKLSFNAGINFSGIALCSVSKITESGENYKSEQTYVDWMRRLYFSLSSQIGVSYKINERTKIGFNLECFFHDFNWYPGKKDYIFYEDSYYLAYKNPSVLINTGIKFQRSF